jgi:hypothetical protein
MVLHQTIRPPDAREGEQPEAHGAAKSPRHAKGKRYSIILRLRHPTLDPANITAALGWEPDQCWKAGDRVIAPNGRELPGVRRDGLWSRAFHFKGNIRIVEEIDAILAHLLIHKELFEQLEREGAYSAIYLQLPGDVNNGDCFSWHVLSKFVDLKFTFEIETFPEWA